MLIKRNLQFAFLFLFGVPITAAAHVKWFVPSETIAPAQSLRFHLADPAVQLWISVIVLALLIAYLLDRQNFAPPRALLQTGERRRGRIIYLFQLIMGLSLLATAYKGSVLAPHLHEGTALTTMFRVAEGLIGLFFISNFRVFWGAILLFILYVASTAVFGFLMSLEYFNLLGIAVFLFLLKAPDGTAMAHKRQWALPLLRVHTGVALSILAFSEKLLRPELAMDFLARHEINFMPLLGFESFSDHLFVLSAGSSELIFGLIFLLGFVTRINTLTIAGFLIASNLYFFLIGKFAEGFLEIIGHANLFAIAMILIFYGAGEKLRFRLGAAKVAVNKGVKA